MTTDVHRLLGDPEVDVIIETMGGTDPALEFVTAALAAGKDVVTANKALLAEHGVRVFAQARAAGRAVAFEGSVGGGIPIVQALSVALAANQVQSLAAIVNGTCNFILTRMTSEGLPYEEALRQAQQLGYAEADPTLDVDGTDTAHKLAILAQLAFEANVRLESIPRQGIDRLQPADLKYSGELGHRIKLLALAKLSTAGLELRVAPTLVRLGTPLADVSGPYNAIRVVGDAVGDTLFYGRGAGALPTASAIVGDLIEVVTGRAGLPSRLRNLWSESAPPVPLTPPSQIKSRYYLRFTIADRPGVLARLAQILGDAGDQHRQRDPARFRRRCPRAEPRPTGYHDPSRHPGGPLRRPGGNRSPRRGPCAEHLPGRRGLRLPAFAEPGNIPTFGTRLPDGADTVPSAARPRNE